MAFIPREWKARLGVGLDKFKWGATGTPAQLINAPDSITQEGDALSATNLNDLETRIKNGFDDCAQFDLVITNQSEFDNWVANRTAKNIAILGSTTPYKTSSSWILNNSYNITGIGQVTIQSNTSTKRTITISYGELLKCINIKFDSTISVEGNAEFDDALNERPINILYERSGWVTDDNTGSTPSSQSQGSILNLSDSIENYTYLVINTSPRQSSGLSDRKNLHTFLVSSLVYTQNKLTSNASPIFLLTGSSLNYEYRVGVGFLNSSNNVDFTKVKIMNINRSAINFIGAY